MYSIIGAFKWASQNSPKQKYKLFVGGRGSMMIWDDASSDHDVRMHAKKSLGYGYSTIETGMELLSSIERGW